jgi:hypothetical protein
MLADASPALRHLGSLSASKLNWRGPARSEGTLLAAGLLQACRHPLASHRSEDGAQTAVVRSLRHRRALLRGACLVDAGGCPQSSSRRCTSPPPRMTVAHTPRPSPRSRATSGRGSGTVSQQRSGTTAPPRPSVERARRRSTQPFRRTHETPARDTNFPSEPPHHKSSTVVSY